MKTIGVLLVVLVAIAGMIPMAVAAPRVAQAGPTEYVVVYAESSSLAAARAAVAAAGGTIVKENVAVGVATVRASSPGFAAAARQQPALFGVSRNISTGFAPQAARSQQDRRAIERLDQERQASKGQAAQAAEARKKPRAEPLADLQWDMQMIRATAEGAYREQPGSKRVLVGILDTGVDGSHPDIAPNFDRKLSRNFTTDIELIDGPCAEEPDQSCEDPADVDENGHGTHVAGTIAAPINGLGIAGVAPNVTIVNLRAGQDSGYFFLQASVDALTYAGDIGVDVVNMSYFIDPWLFNCASNPADSPEAQLEQRTIIEGTQRALRYARRNGVTLVAALGNENTDLGKPTTDPISPDFPPDAAYERTIDNSSCLTLPAEGSGVIGVSAVGPSMRKAYYSNYGREQADVSAPGGDYRDFPGTDRYRTAGNLILAPYPEALARANDELNPDGTPNNPFVVRDCKGNVCAYYQYLQGTSMAAPHAVGVAALIVSEYGRRDEDHKGGLTLDPARTAEILKNSATDVACPQPRLFTYPELPPQYNAECSGGKGFNGFYGHGIVDALRAVER